MTRLEAAMQLANDRKKAAVGGGVEPGIVFGDTFSDRAVFSGYDIEHEELIATSTAVAEFYSNAAQIVGLRALFISAWCDGLLTGLMLASLPPTPNESDGMEASDSEG